MILPAYNESQAIGTVLDNLVPPVREKGWEVLVVGDGSEDPKGKIAQDHGAKVLTRPYNRGYGASIKTGGHAASGDVIVIIDSCWFVISSCVQVGLTGNGKNCG